MDAGSWSSADLPLGLRAEATRTMISKLHLPWSLTLRDGERHNCRLNWHPLAGCSVIECRSDRLAGRRDGRELRQTVGDYLGLLLVLAGRERVRQDDVAVELGAGDLLLWDGARPIGFEIIDALHKVTLLIPRERLQRAMTPDTEVRGAVQLDARSGLGVLAAGHLASLARVARDIPTGHVPLAADIMVDLLGRLLDRSAVLDAPGDLIARVFAHIETHLDDPDLTPSHIAAAFDITPRYLHMLFSSTGATLSAYIRRRRLEAMRRDLADSRLATRSIAEIALHWGFSDSAHASRAFSTAYGIAPSRYRATRLQG
jgi:AraC-like DNA-binding protein